MRNVFHVPTLAPAETTEVPERVNILVVDDLEEKLLVYRTILEELDQNLVFARSGEEALKLVLNNEFAVILLDVNMPGMDGIETAELIRKRRKSAATPIIFLTAFSDDVHLEQGYASGAVDYLLTPVMPEILKAKVRVFIELSRMRFQAAQQAEEHARHKAAQESALRKDKFLSMLAHELRNPLGPIRNAIQLLQNMGPATPGMVRLRTIIERQVAHMARLVDDLLDSRRLADGRILLQKEPCDLTHIVHNTIEDYRMIFDEKKVRLQADLPSQAIWVEGDPTRLVQMCGNILHNAHKFTDTGGTVSVTLAVDDAKKACLTVRDSGVGIEPEKLPYIFDLFYQSEQTLARSRGGLGLGLSLVKGIAELHGGSIVAESAGKDQGACFTLHLPLTEAPAQTARVIPFSRERVRRRILLIEDNPDAAETMRLLLESEGHEARTAKDGAEGISLAREFLPHIIMCDIGLPGMDGYEVARLLRQEQAPALHSAFLIALTGYGREEDRRRALEAGFNLHLVKPVELNSLRQALLQMNGETVAPPAAARKPEKQSSPRRNVLVPALQLAACCAAITALVFLGAEMPPLLKILGSLLVSAALFFTFRAYHGIQDMKRTADPGPQNETLRQLNHALRTPLTTVSGVAEMLENSQDNLDPRQKQLVRALKLSTASLKTIVNDIPALSAKDTEEKEDESRPQKPLLSFLRKRLYK